MIDELTENIARRVRRETLMEMEAIEEGRMVVPELLSREEQFQEKKKFANVIGRILASGRPLPKCNVKLVQLVEKRDILRKVYKIRKNSAGFDAITGPDGRYTFEWVPPGIYKVYWRPVGVQSWVRLRKMVPDVVVKAGETVGFQDIETNLPAVVTSENRDR